MTDEDCGCRCRDCSEFDLHRCGLEACGYTAYLAKTAPIEHPKPPEAPELLRAQFRSIPNPESKARLGEWFRFCQETAGLDSDLREAKRRERYAEIFGGMA